MQFKPGTWWFALTEPPLTAIRQQPGVSVGAQARPLGHWNRYLARLCVLVVAYYAAAHIGYALRFAGPVGSIVWLPVGVGVVALYLFGPQLWPGVVIGDLLVNNYGALPVPSAIGQTFGNLLEVLIAAVLLRRFASRTPLLGSIAGLARLLVALMVGTAASATIGLLSLYLGHVVTLGAIPHLWRTWWLGDLCGALIVVPLALAWFPPLRRPWLHGRWTEAALLLVTLLALIGIAWQSGPPLSYLALPALTWAALRFGPSGATLAVTIGAAFTMWATTHYLGPFAFHSVSRSVLDTQLYLALSTVATLSVAVLAQEREQLADSVRASRTRIVSAADEERRRVERNLHDGAQQRLVALAIHLGLAAEEARAEPQAVVSSLESARRELELAIDDLRELAHGIRPPALRNFGLANAIELVAARSATSIEVGELPRERLDDTAEVTAYYVILEAITNAEKYAHAPVIRVRVRLRAGSLELEVEDDGVGGAVERDDLGLQGLRDRVEATGGSFAVDSEPGEGTRITATIPAAVIGQ